MELWIAEAIGTTAAWVTHSFGWVALIACWLIGWQRKPWIFAAIPWGIERAITIPSVLQWRAQLGVPTNTEALIIRALPALALCFAVFFLARLVRNRKAA